MSGKLVGIVIGYGEERNGMTEALEQAANELPINARLEVVMKGLHPTFGYIKRMGADAFRFTCKRDTPTSRRPYNRFSKPTVYSAREWEFWKDDFMLLAEFNALMSGEK